LFFRLFPVESGAAAAVDLALILIGVNLAVILPLSVFDAVLWANQRFDLLNAVDIPSLALRVVLTLSLVRQDSGSLVTLGWILITGTAVDGLITAVLAFRVDPDLRLRPQLVRWTVARRLGGFGFWLFLSTVARSVGANLGPVLIANQLRSVALVASYNF